MNVASLLGSVLARLRRSRYKALLGMTLLCLLLRENYPFSNFPMYSSFSHWTYYLYLTDANGAALKTRAFGLSSSALKKIFDRYRRVELERYYNSGSERVRLAEEAAGLSLLRYLDGLAAGRPPAAKMLAGLHVQHVRVQQDAHDLILETRTLARHQ